MLEIRIPTSRKPETANTNAASFRFTNLASSVSALLFSCEYGVWPFDLVFTKVYVPRESIILKMVCQESFSYDWNNVIPGSLSIELRFKIFRGNHQSWLDRNLSLI